MSDARSLQSSRAGWFWSALSTSHQQGARSFAGMSPSKCFHLPSVMVPGSSRKSLMRSLSTTPMQQKFIFSAT
eukprot:4775353-Karenia_brevis.AAC.1